MTPHSTGWAEECGRGTEAPNTSWEGYGGPTRDENGTGASCAHEVAGLGGIQPRRLQEWGAYGP